MCLWLGALLLVSAGCGVKAPPVAPDAKPPMIATFVHTLDSGMLTLSWGLAGASPVPQRYTVYRSREPMADKPCRGCPLVFRRLMTIPSNGRKRGTEIMAIEPGYRYGFKMSATDSSGFEGPASSTVKFTY